MVMIDFTHYDIVHCGISGGKDSQAAATWLVRESGCPVEKIRLSFNDTGNEHEWTYEHIKRISGWLGIEIATTRAELDFYELAERKKRFPSAKARFCTEYLKMRVTQKYILEWMRDKKNVLLISGVRADESIARSRLPQFEFDTYYACDVYRPLIEWTLDQVLAFIDGAGQFVNPLYGMGAQRVGCFPCIMSRKREIRMIADQFPERIDMIREWENKIGDGGASFFSRSYVPARFRRKAFFRNGEMWMVASIDDVVDWAHTARGGKEYDSGPQGRLFEDLPTCINGSGACE